MDLLAIAGHQGQALRYKRSHQERTGEQGLSLRKSPPMGQRQKRISQRGYQRDERKPGSVVSWKPRELKRLEKLEVT